MNTEEKPTTVIIEKDEHGHDVEKTVGLPDSFDTRVIIGKLDRIHYKLQSFKNLFNLMAIMIFIIMVMLGVFVSQVL